MIKLIVALDKNNLMGTSKTYNGIPWENKEDLKHFRQTTLNQTLIMGSHTYDIIGKPLPKRKTIVYTRKLRDDIETIQDIDTFIKAYPKDKDLFICGGRYVYEKTLPLCDELIISRIDGDYQGEVYFPTIPDYFKLTEIIKKETFNVEIYKKENHD